MLQSSFRYRPMLFLAIICFVAFVPVVALAAAGNPLLDRFATPHGVPPFNLIKNSDFVPAFQKAIEAHSAEIRAIADDPEPPTFANTIERYDAGGELLYQVRMIFYNLLATDTDDERQAIAQQVSPLLSAHNDDVLLNAKLFQRIKAVHDQSAQLLDLKSDQKKLLEDTYREFVRGGAALTADQQKELREVNQQLSLLGLKFGDNVLAETNDFRLVIDRQEDLAGLPKENVEAAADAAAKEAGMQGKWVFLLQSPSLYPFLQYSDRRELREKIWRAYMMRSNNGGEHDNNAVIAGIVQLRDKRAKLLGYHNHAEYVLEEQTAKTPDKVYAFLNKVWTAALPIAKQEAAELQAIADKEGGNFKLQPWDWRYYAEKLRKEKYDLNDELLRPYLALPSVRRGVFSVAHRLYGLTFKARPDLPRYNPTVEAYEVRDARGLVGIVYMDFYSRTSKRGGAWEESLRRGRYVGSKRVVPVAVTVFNFPSPAAGHPALLSFEEATTMFHEFGHALHHILSDVRYATQSGTAVPNDFVEMPSQIMENWAMEPAVLKTYAVHYKTGKPMPDALIAKIQNSRMFNQGFDTVEYLAASLLDMDYHTAPVEKLDPQAFEAASMQKIGLIPEILPRYRSTYFQHIFSGDGEYSAGYYSYAWSEILDADAFEAFKEKGLFDQKTAKAFRDNILSRGGSEDAMELYKRFRGSEPKIEPYLKRHGLLQQVSQ